MKQLLILITLCLTIPFAVSQASSANTSKTSLSFAKTTATKQSLDLTKELSVVKNYMCRGRQLEKRIAEGDKSVKKEWNYLTKELADYLGTLTDKYANDEQKLKELGEGIQYLSDNLETLCK